MPSIKNVRVYDLAESIYRSGYPLMIAEPTEDMFNSEVADISQSITDYRKKMETLNNNVFSDNVYRDGVKSAKEVLLRNHHIKRASRLATIDRGGEDQFLTGITVSFDLKLSLLVWRHMQRYNFVYFVSSMSIMHRARHIVNSEAFNKYVNESISNELKGILAEYTECLENGTGTAEQLKEYERKLVYNIPVGFELSAGMTTNYRSLKNIYSQRRNHKMPDWQYVCDWIETLPLSDFLITGKDM